MRLASPACLVAAGALGALCKSLALDPRGQRLGGRLGAMRLSRGCTGVLGGTGPGVSSAPGVPGMLMALRVRPGWLCQGRSSGGQGGDGGDTDERWQGTAM